MDKEFTRMWQCVRQEQSIDWASWLGEPMLYDGGLFVNRTENEHYYSRIIYGRIRSVV